MNHEKRLLFDCECKDCEKNTKCQWAEMDQSCRKIIDKIRYELGKNIRKREVINKIAFTIEMNYGEFKTTKSIADWGEFSIRKPYSFALPFSRSEIIAEDNNGKFKTQYYGWSK